MSPPAAVDNGCVDSTPIEWCLTCPFPDCRMLYVTVLRSCPRHPEHAVWAEEHKKRAADYGRTEQVRAYQRKWSKDNREKRLEYLRDYRALLREKTAVEC